MQSLLGGTRVKMAFQRTLSDSLFTPVDAASLAVIRIGFGSIMLLEMLCYFYMDWVRYYYITPEFHFSYYGFDWVQPWSGIGMYLHFSGLALLVFYRHRLSVSLQLHRLYAGFNLGIPA